MAVEQYHDNKANISKKEDRYLMVKTGKALMAKKNYPEFVKQYLKYNQRERRG